MAESEEIPELSLETRFLLRAIEKGNCAAIDHANTLQTAFDALAAKVVRMEDSHRAEVSDLRATIRTLSFHPTPPAQKAAPKTGSFKAPHSNPTGANKSNSSNNTAPSNNGNKSYAKAAAAAAAPADQEFVTVQKKKKVITPFFEPGTSRLSQQIIIATADPIPNTIANDTLLEVINLATGTQKFPFHAARRSMNGNLTLETSLTTTADQGVALEKEIAMGLDILSITVTNVYANSHWSQFVIHGIPSDIGTTN